jgi:hypothetical protein
MDLEETKNQIKDNFESKIKPAKNKTSRFKRGTLVLCLVLSPGQKYGQLVNLRKEENILSNKQENQKFLIMEPPALEFSHNYRSYPVYVCDAEKGVTVSLEFNRAAELSSMFCDPKMLSNVFDETFISKASNIKPDWKQLIGLLFSVLYSGA